jgi:hypothetical protein
MASIVATKVEVFDNGLGVGASIDISVLVGEQTVLHNLKGSALGLTPAQTANLQAAIDLLRTRAVNITKTEFTIP